MAAPKKKRSKSRSKRHKNIWKAFKKEKLMNKVSLKTCKNCGNKKLNHRVCPECGYYKGEQVMTVKSNDNVIEA